MEEPRFWPSKGHYNLDQYYFVSDLLKDKNIQYALETGFCTGRSALSVLHNSPNLKKMTSIDIDLDYPNIGGRKMSQILSENFSCFSVIESDSRKQFNTNFLEENYPVMISMKKTKMLFQKLSGIRTEKVSVFSLKTESII